MDSMRYEAYREWRDSMLLFQEDLEWDENEEADFAVWDAADHEARDDFNLFLAAKTLDQVSFTEMKEMELRYEQEN
ncbi:hypothetical protein [Jeotgalibaca sp. A122]|uniref:hypothetical protein n=1 Tax=Jeotgalibaca sp. A122 TaxID=3457322 RepID=UPI003FCFB153